MRALIIDDSRANRMVLQRILKELAFETTEAENALDAIWTLNKGEDIALITVDYNMPKMTGTQFVRLVREKPELGEVRIIMITSENSPQRREEALQAGANEFLVKPFTKEMIEEKLAALGLGSKTPPAPEKPPETSDDA
ncbi:MAG: response regulator [Verrucomicrobia bacterium]|nr:response regulator [Verrucomicrobiota bacterium]